MTYEKPEINRVGQAAAVILGPTLRNPSDNSGSGENTSQGDLVLGLDD